MRNIMKLASLLSIILLLCNCSSDDETEEIPFSTEQIEGTWRISFYTDEIQNITYNNIDLILLFEGSEGSGTIRTISPEDTTSGTVTYGGYELQQFEIDGEIQWDMELAFDVTSSEHDMLDDIENIWPITRVYLDTEKIEFEKVLNPEGQLEVLHLTRVSNGND